MFAYIAIVLSMGSFSDGFDYRKDSWVVKLAKLQYGAATPSITTISITTLSITKKWATQ